MGGDKGPAPVIAGLARFLAGTPGARVILHGPEDQLRPLLAKRRIDSSRVEIRHATEVVATESGHAARARNLHVVGDRRRPG